jgi:hypothetical protein
MPHIIVRLYPGKSEEQKKKLADEIVKDVVTNACPMHKCEFFSSGKTAPRGPLGVRRSRNSAENAAQRKKGHLGTDWPTFGACRTLLATTTSTPRK